MDYASHPVFSAMDIDRKLHEDFRRRVAEYGIQTETVDPVLSVLFRTFAQQLETFYSETDRIRLALLDELISGLGIQRRSARPAQTVVRFVMKSGSQLIESGTPLTGTTAAGERLSFRTDVNVNVSPARVAFIGAYENGALQLGAPAILDERFHAARPALDPVQVDLGPNPALYFAIERLGPDHLSWHSLVFDISPDGKHLQSALEWEPWCLIDEDGVLSSAGLLRPSHSNGAVRQLNWFVPPAGSRSPECAAQFTTGFYGPRTFVFPEVPASRRFACKLPRQLESALHKIFGRQTSSLFEEPRAWIRIGLPPTCSASQRVITGILGNATTASNVECINQTVYFERQGTSIPVGKEAGTSKHLIAPLSVLGESGNAYQDETQPASQGETAGRYTIHNGRLELRPGLLANGEPERYATLRMLVTAGSVGNFVGPGRTQTFETGDFTGSISVVNPVSAAGGADQENFEQAQLRFHGALLSRDRIVTRADLISAVRSFDRRILDVSTEVSARRTPQGLTRIQSVVVVLRRADFTDPDRESQFLERELTEFLAGRVVYGLILRVRTNWS